jgi:hypothetical protein
VYIDQGGRYQGVLWDMHVCHTWYRVALGAGNVPLGPHNQSDVLSAPCSSSRPGASGAPSASRYVLEHVDSRAVSGRLGPRLRGIGEPLFHTF